MDLGDIRRGIDQVNRDLVGLLNKRFDLVDRVGLYKFIEGLEIENKSREHDIKASLLRDFDLKDEAIVG
ncbi:MAG: chorismate mutase, partial [Peptostreptococcus sp.]|nr:chorismate mutase [Peptostreptococcus sp.]